MFVRFAMFKNIDFIRAKLESFGVRYVFFISPLDTATVFNASVWWRCLVVGLRTIYRGDRMVALPLW